MMRSIWSGGAEGGIIRVGIFPKRWFMAAFEFI